MPFNEDPGWTVFKTMDPNFIGRSGVGNHTLPATWTIKAPATSPACVKAFSDYEAGQTAGAATNPFYRWNTELSQTTSFRISCDARGDVLGVETGGMILLCVVDSSFTSFCGIDIKRWTPDTPDWSYEYSPTYTQVMYGTGWTDARYYRIGLKKIETRLSYWIDFTPSTTPQGANGDKDMVQVGTGTTTATFASLVYPAAFTSYPETVHDINYGSISYIHVEELALDTGVPSEASPAAFITPAFPSFSWSFPSTDQSPFDISFNDINAYHRHKTLRAAADSLNHLKLSP